MTAKPIFSYILICIALFTSTIYSADPSGWGGKNKKKRKEKQPTFKLKSAKKIPRPKKAGFAKKPSFFDNFDPQWENEKENWIVATWKQNKTKMDRSRCYTNSDGHLVQIVKAGFPGKGGSIQSKKEYGFGRWVARIKTSPVKGVLNTIFTKDWDDMLTSDSDRDGKKGEIDIELLSHTYGKNKGEVHLAIHLANHNTPFVQDVPLDFNPSDDFHEWGFDIYPDRIVWHVDGKFIREWKYTKEFKIDPQYEFFFNSWTMKKWIQGPPKKDATYLIDWVKFYPYTKNN